MTDEIYLSTANLSSQLLSTPICSVDNACRSLSSIGSNPVYTGTTGQLSLYSTSVLDEIKSIKNQLSTISSMLSGYGCILNTGPEDLADIDAGFKSEITTWFDRADYRVDNFFADIKTGAESTINYWVDNYTNKGWSYKVVQSAIAIGKAAPAIIGCAASWVAAPWSPTTWLSTVYTINDGVSMCADLHNIWNENYEDVGTVNLLQDALVEGGAELSQMLGFDEDVGEIVGNGVYHLGELVNIASGFENLQSNVIQNDLTFDTVSGAIKETPDAVKGIWDIATNSSITEVAKDFKLLTYTTPNIVETVSAIGLLSDVGSTASDFSTKTIETVSNLK